MLTDDMTDDFDEEPAKGVETQRIPRLRLKEGAPPRDQLRAHVIFENTYDPRYGDQLDYTVSPPVKIFEDPDDIVGMVNVDLEGYHEGTYDLGDQLIDMVDNLVVTLEIIDLDGNVWSELVPEDEDEAPAGELASRVGLAGKDLKD